MNGKLPELKKRMLVAKIARQRLDLAVDARIIETPLHAMDKGISLIRYVKAHPLIPASLALFCLLMKPARTLRWGRRIWFVARLLKNVRNELA